jgi:hypothetical protein
MENGQNGIISAPFGVVELHQVTFAIVMRIWPERRCVG